MKRKNVLRIGGVVSILFLNLHLVSAVAKAETKTVELTRGKTTLIMNDAFPHWRLKREGVSVMKVGMIASSPEGWNGLFSANRRKGNVKTKITDKGINWEDKIDNKFSYSYNLSLEDNVVLLDLEYRYHEKVNGTFYLQMDLASDLFLGKSYQLFSAERLIREGVIPIQVPKKWKNVASVSVKDLKSASTEVLTDIGVVTFETTFMEKTNSSLQLATLNGRPLFYIKDSGKGGLFPAGYHNKIRLKITIGKKKSLSKFKRIKNLLGNGSFELATNPDVPDYWFYYLGLKHFSRFYSSWTLDTNVAFKGKNSMRLNGMPLWNSEMLKRNLQSGTSYVLSGYMKSDTPGQKVDFTISNRGWRALAKKTFSLEKDWKRFWLPVELKKQGGIRFFISPNKASKGTIWVDAVQLEKGNTPTEFNEDAWDKGKENRRKKQESKPKVFSGRVATGPKIDGVLDDACWKKAGQVKDFNIWQGALPQEKTEVWVCHDQEALYVAFYCYNSNPAEICKREKERDSGKVFADDCVEIFLDTNLDRETYYHIATNPLGTRFDEKGKVGAGSWDGDWQVACRENSKGWIAEFRLPFNIFNLGLDTSDVWGISFCRDRKFKKSKESSFWGGGWHNVKKFGRLEGFSPDIFRKFFFSIDNTSYTYKSLLKDEACLTGNVTNLSGKSRAVKLSIKRGDSQAETDSILIPSSVTTEFQIEKLPITKSKTAIISVKDAQTNNVLHASRQRIASPALAEIFLDRSYYTTEKVAKLMIHLNLVKELRKNVSLKVNIFDEDKKLILTREAKPPLQKKLSIHIPVKEIKPGQYTVSVSITGKKDLWSKKIKLSRMNPTINEAKIDYLKRCILVEGKVFIPFMASFSRIQNSQGRFEELLDGLQEHGYNCVNVGFCVSWAKQGKKFAELKQIKHFLDLVSARGMKAFIPIQPDYAGSESKGPLAKIEANQRYLSKYLPELKDHPAVIGWILDEPSGAVMKNGIREKLASQIKKESPHDLFIVNHWKGPLGSIYRNNLGVVSDVVSLDYYFIGGHPISSMVPLLEIQEELAEQKKPINFYFQTATCPFEAGQGARCPTVEEERAMAYMALVYGATCYSPWPGWSESKLLWEYLPKLSSELQTLKEVITAEEVGKVNRRGDIYTSTRRSGKKIFVVAVNISNDPGEVLVNLSALGIKKAKIQPFFEGKMFTISQGMLKDRIEGLGRCAYEVIPF